MWDSLNNGSDMVAVEDFTQFALCIMNLQDTKHNKMGMDSKVEAAEFEE